MARDLKLTSWTWADDTATGKLIVAKQTPTGDVTDSAGQIRLAVTTSGTSIKAVSNSKNIGGFRNTKNPSDFANFIAGNEVTAIVGDPAVWGSTSYGEMFARCAVTIGAQTTGATCVWATDGFIVLEGAYDNGAGAADTQWQPISGTAPLTLPAAYLAATALASNTFTTAYPHKLTIGDFVVFDSVTGLAGAGAPTAGQVYVVQSVPSGNQFTIATVAASTVALVVTGTPTANVIVRKLLSGNGLSRIVNVPMVASVRPWIRWALYYSTSSTTNVSTVTISKTSLVLGKDNAIAF
jgi:hypothetical protein